MSASAAVQAESSPIGRPELAAPETQARGLIVKTTTATPSDSLLAAADDALGAEAEVVEDDVVTDKISVVDFDELVDAEVAAEAAAEIEQRSDVVWAIPDALLQPTAAPPVSVNDPMFPSQTNLWNTAGAPGGFSIKAPSLWRATKGNPAVTVAVLDTGILSGHPELAGQVTAGYDMVDRDGNAEDPGDWNAAGECGSGSPATSSSWHGTFVAGIIAARADNNAGIAGVAPGVKIRPVRVLGKCGGTTRDVLDGMIWASGGSPGGPAAAKVVNLSLSLQAAGPSQRDNYCELYNAVASQGRARGSVFVAAAGNDYGNANLTVPSACSQLISVGATSIKGFSSSYSNIGSAVDIAAPGGDAAVEGSKDLIRSLDNAGTKAPAPSGYGYSSQQGTSMAAPEVSAAAALLVSLGFSTPAQVQKALYASVAPFRARSTSYAKKRVRIGNGVYQMDLNCRGHAWCGRGILDLSRVEVPLTAPTVKGEVVIGEPLTASIGTWVRVPSARTYSWLVGGVLKSTLSTYWPTAADVGKTITVKVSPANAAFAKLGSTSAATGPVSAGPVVTLTAPVRSRYGSAFKVAVTSSEDGPVQIRTDAGAVVGVGTVVGGKATITIAGKKLKPGGQRIRAAYLGTNRASSPRKTVSVKKLQAKVSRSLRARVKTTSRATLKVRVNERPNLFAGPTGKLRVYDGSRRIVTKTLRASDRGRKSIRLPRLKKGKHRIKVVYSGNTYIGAKSSSRRTIKAY